MSFFDSAKSAVTSAISKATDATASAGLGRKTAKLSINLLSYPTGIDTTEGYPRAVFTIFDDLYGQKLESSVPQGKAAVAPEGIPRSVVDKNIGSIQSASSTGNIKVVAENPINPGSPSKPILSPAVMMAQGGGVDGKDNPVSNGIANKITDTTNFFQEKTGAVLTSIGNTASDISKNVTDSFDSVKNKLGTGLNDLQNSEAFKSVSGAVGNFAGSLGSLLESSQSLIATAGIATGLASALGVFKNPKIANSLGKAGVALTLGSVATSFLSNASKKLGEKKVANVNSEVKKTASDSNVDLSKQESLNVRTKNKPEQKAITGAIVLPMPESLRYSVMTQFGEEDFPILGALNGSLSQSDLLNAVGVGAAGAAGALIGNAAKNSKSTVGKIIQNVAGRSGTQGAQTAIEAARAGLRFQGIVNNPRKNVVFQGIGYRQFQFVYNFFPKSLEEAQRVEEIIKRFRFYSSPQGGETGDTFTFRAPAEFEVKFFIGSEENTKIPRIKRFYMRDLMVDYAPSGRFVSFDTGFPPEITMSFTAYEKELVTREAIGADQKLTDKTGY